MQCMQCTVLISGAPLVGFVFWVFCLQTYTIILVLDFTVDGPRALLHVHLYGALAAQPPPPAVPTLAAGPVTGPGGGAAGLGAGAPRAPGTQGVVVCRGVE